MYFKSGNVCKFYLFEHFHAHQIFKIIQKQMQDGKVRMEIGAQHASDKDKQNILLLFLIAK